MSAAKYIAELSMPIATNGLISADSRGRSKLKMVQSARGTIIKIEAGDMVAFRAAVNSILRDMSIVDSVSKVAIAKPKRKA